MSKNPLKLLEVFPRELLDKAYEKTFLPGETIAFSDQEMCFFILEGWVLGKSKNNIYFPKVIKAGDMFGFEYYMSERHSFISFKSQTTTKILVFPDKIIKDIIVKDFAVYKSLVKLQTKILEYMIKFLFLKSDVSSKAACAYFLLMNSSEGIFHYAKHEDIHKLLNMSRTSYFKIEKEFIDKELIKKVPKKVVILDLEGLIEYFKEYIGYDEIYERGSFT